MLLAGVSTLEIDSELVKSFINAAHFDDVFEVRKLLGFGVPINSQDNDGKTALYWAVFSNNKDVVDELIGNGADVNLQNGYDWTPLHAAAHENNTDMMKVLLLHGADSSIRNSRGETALDVALTFNKEEAARLLERY